MIEKLKKWEEAVQGNPPTVTFMQLIPKPKRRSTTLW